MEINFENTEIMNWILFVQVPITGVIVAATREHTETRNTVQVSSIG